MNTFFEGKLGDYTRKGLLAAVVMIALSYGVSSVESIVNLSHADYTHGSITITGHGEVLSVPDIATFTYSVVADKPTVADAQAEASQTANTIASYLKAAAVADADVQTTDYSVSPQYDYVQPPCTTGTYCQGKQVLKGYEVRQSTKVKVRDTAKAGELLAGVGTKGATEVSGLSFTFDDPSIAQGQAREKAVTDAKVKAEKLAQSLGAHLGSVTSFDENLAGSNTNPVPMYAKAVGAGMSDAVAPQIAAGQNTVDDDVTITYEIR